MSKRRHVISALSLARIVIVLVAVTLFCIIPLMKNDKKVTGIKEDLLSNYPDADITRIICSNSSIGSEFLFQVLDSNGEVVGEGYSDKNGHVTSDTYANHYFMEQMESYFIETVDPEGNYPGVITDYSVDITSNIDRMVITEQVSSFEDYLDPENVRFNDGYGNYATIYVWISSEDAMNDVISMLEEADYRMEVFFYESGSDSMLSVGHYTPGN